MTYTYRRATTQSFWDFCRRMEIPFLESAADAVNTKLDNLKAVVRHGSRPHLEFKGSDRVGNQIIGSIGIRLSDPNRVTLMWSVDAGPTLRSKSRGDESMGAEDLTIDSIVDTIELTSS